VQTGKAHHSSYTRGGKVLFAGEWRVERGVLKYLSARSGHYTPSILSLKRFMDFLESKNIPVTGVALHIPKQTSGPIDGLAECLASKYVQVHKAVLLNLLEANLESLNAVDRQAVNTFSTDDPTLRLLTVFMQWRLDFANQALRSRVIGSLAAAERAIQTKVVLRLLELAPDCLQAQAVIAVLRAGLTRPFLDIAAQSARHLLQLEPENRQALDLVARAQKATQGLGVLDFCINRFFGSDVEF
jgi:hypothetical protein